MSANNPSLDSTLKRVRAVRTLLLRLHKELLESERVVYEQFHGRIQSSSEYFRLVVEHEWFSWLRPISQYIAHIDEELSPKKSMTLEKANQLLDEVRSLLQPAEEGNTLQKQYYRAIQRSPDIALTNAEITKLLTTDS